MIDVTGSREIQATVYALRAARKDVRTGINKTARQTLRPLWQAELARRATTPLERAVILPGARVAASDRQFTLLAATKNRPLRGGLQPSSNTTGAPGWPGVEYGARTRRMRVRQRARSTHRVYEREMMINRQLKSRTERGRVAMPAAAETGKRLVALWVVHVVDSFRAVPGAEVVP